MRLCWKGWMTVLLLTVPMAGWASTCTTQAEMTAQDRNAIATAGQGIALAVLQQDYETLHGALLQAVSQDWDGIRGAVEDAAPLMRGGHAQLRSIYLLDSTSGTAPATTQFFCSNESGSLTVTITMRSLPPGRYAMVLADAAGAPMGGQIGLVLVWDQTGSVPRWKLGGLSLRQGIIDGHDGVWYWTRARALAESNAPWSAFYSYELARYLLLPVDYISSPNLEKLNQEQSDIHGGPSGAFPYSLKDGDRTWKIDGIRLDTRLHEADLGVTYESIGVSDPSAMRTEAVAVLSALLKAHPQLRENFHGLWAYASRDGKVSTIIELPMAQIP